MSEYRDWQVGDRVVCIDASPIISNEAGSPKGLAEGRFYRIRWIGEFYFDGPEQTVIAVRLDGYIRDKDDTPVGANRFRKVQPRKTDISIFTAMLHGERQKVDA